VNDAKLIVDTMAAMDYKPLMIGGGGAFVYTSFIKDLGEQANGMMSVSSWVWDNAWYMANPDYKNVIEPMFRAENKEFMAEQVGPAFVCTMMIYEAVEETGSTDRIVIRDYIKTMTGENSPWFALYHPKSKFNEKGKKALETGASIKELFGMPVREKIGRAKYVKEDEVNKAYDEIESELDSQIEKLLSKEAD
jgi:ABC-type branched-subunit amino acid transport system substrate-binding protein